MISQIDLISAIMRWLDKQGVKGANPRQLNSIIAAANIIVDALGEPHRPAVPGMGLPAWMNCDETGMSSNYMARVLSGVIAGEVAYPRDPDDFGRCVNLLLAAPELRSKLDRLREGHGKQWAALARHWNELETLWNEEKPSGKCPRLYARMLELMEADPCAKS